MLRKCTWSIIAVESPRGRRGRLQKTSTKTKVKPPYVLGRMLNCIPLQEGITVTQRGVSMHKGTLSESKVSVYPGYLYISACDISAVILRTTQPISLIWVLRCKCLANGKVGQPVSLNCYVSLGKASN